MSYNIGCVWVDEALDTPNLVFPIKSQFGWTGKPDQQVVTHQFGNGDGKIEQRFYLGQGKNAFTVNLQPMSTQRRKALIDFWNSIGGPQQAFWYDVPSPNGQQTSRFAVIFDPEQSLTWTKASDLLSQSTVDLIIVPDPAAIPTYTSSEVTQRFTSAALESALTGQVQEVIPLVTITPRFWRNNSSFVNFGALANGGSQITVTWWSRTATHTELYLGNPFNPTSPGTGLGTGTTTGIVLAPNTFGAEFVLVDTDTNRIIASNVLGGTTPLYLSDRLCSVDGVIYRPRLLTHSGISQSLGPSDDATFQFANADRVFTHLKNAMNLNRADVQFCLFHTGTRSQVQLWRGEAKSWSADENSIFQLSCSDSIYELTLPYPARTITRECYKPFNDNRLCPYTTAGSGGDPNFCDKLFDSQSGCQSHGMANYFGGITATPQGVAIRDNGSSGRPTITATSIVSDTMYGRALQEVYTDIEMPVNCIIADGRDESDFYEAIGIVGSPVMTFGPVQNQLLDGQTQNYPYSPIMVPGGDPNPVPFSLDAGGNFQYPYKAAGVSWISIRRTDQKGIQPSSPDDHQLVASIIRGSKGLVWLAPGNNGGAEVLLTNPIWVAVNAMLRSKGMGFGTPMTTQEQQFDVPSAIAAASICDIQTPTLVYNRNPIQLPVDGANVGVGNWTPINGVQPQLPNETQFQFIGIIKDQQPLRDWLDQILLNCNGYWYTAFGKIAFGIRENAGAAEAFTIGNMIYKSFADGPYKPESGAFNDLTAVFADRDYKFAQNTVRYYDQDHAISLGSTVAPRYEKGTINLSGTCSASQALRIAATGCREALGGVDEFEWKSARTATWKTTILALNTFPGQVVSVTHPDATNGYAKFRIKSWTLNYDYSISLTGTTVTDSMYDLEAGPKPADVLPPTLPRVSSIVTDQLPTWSSAALLRSFNTNYIQKSSFRVFKVAQPQPDGSWRVTLTCSGYMPVTSYFTNAKPSVGSVIPFGPGTFGNQRWYLSICGINAAGYLSAPSTIAMCYGLPGGSGFLFSNVQFPTGSVNWALFVGETTDTMTASQLGSLATQPGLTAQNPLGFGRPADYWQNARIRIKAKLLPYLGNGQGTVTGIAAGNQMTVNADLTEAKGTGTLVSNFGPPGDGYIPLADVPMAGAGPQDSGGGVVSFNSVADLNQFSIGDRFAIRYGSYGTQRGISPTNTAYTIKGPQYTVQSTPWPTNSLAGKIIRIIGGTGTGQVRQIASNTESVITVSSPFTTIPGGVDLDNISLGIQAASFFIEDSMWTWQADSLSIANPDPNAQVSVSLTIPSVPPGVSTLLVAGFLASNGYESSEENAPYREVVL